jgi:hypothetical protein
MIPSIFLAGVFGALIGSVVSVITTILSGRLQHRRELVRHATQVAIEDFKATSALAGQDGVCPYPMSTYIHYHLAFLRLAERGELDQAAIKRLLDDRGRLLDLYANYPEERHAFLAAPAVRPPGGSVPPSG